MFGSRCDSRCNAARVKCCPTLKDAKGFVKGTYDPKTNKTKDKRGFTVGTGNLLMTLLDS